MAMEKARPRRSGSAAARFARSRRAQTGEQVLTSTRRAMNSSPQTRHGNTTPPPRPGSHTIPETTTVEERAALGALIARYRHAVLVYCRISVTAVNPNTPLHGTSVRTRGPAEELRYRLDRAVEGSTAGLPTMDELTTPQNFELVESWRRAAQASGSQRARLPGRTLVGNVDRPTVPDGSQGRGRGHPGPCRPRPAVQEHLDRVAVPQPRITGVSRPRIPLYTLQAGCDRTTRANARLLTCPGRVIPGWASISPAVTHRPGHRLCRRCPRWQIRTRSVTTCSRPVHSPGENNYQCQKSAEALHIWAGAPGGGRTHTGRILSPLPLPVGLRGRPLKDIDDAGRQHGHRRPDPRTTSPRSGRSRAGQLWPRRHRSRS
jgi:hypothetical protein